MNLDKRIKALTDIQSVTDGCHDWEFMTKKGYFAESITEFEDLKKCVYAEYIGYREHERCFHYWDEKDGKDYTHYARYFLPEDSLLPKEPEKKYRPYTLAEWVNKHEIGDVVKFRNSKGQEFHVLYTGFTFDTSDDIQDTRTKGQIMFMSVPYSFQELFDNYEICVYGRWQPFGTEVKENE